MSPSDTAALPSVLVVDDEKEVADAYALRLDPISDVQTAYDGETALRIADEEPVDVVLLDRHMPSLSGDEVLEELTDREFRGRVIMVTAIDPAFDVLGMPFDDYLCKPVDREDLQAAVEHQCTVLAYETLGEYSGAEAKRAVVESEVPAEERADHDEFERVEARAERLERRVRRLLDDADSVLDTFDDIGRGS
ncbi:response regulator [Haloarcula litorea]|uniref:response regulator n=1 Tax=Haloarcula litorea TaxID=3032579 RepID=UPI0023E769B8|nr:response regulator [Halomicroarcula sp. GDY20]